MDFKIFSQIIAWIILFLTTGCISSPMSKEVVNVEDISATIESGRSLYLKNCSQCHGQDRLGGMGPSLIPESLEKQPHSKLMNVIKEGLIATQMPSFVGILSESEMNSISRYLKSDLSAPIVWGIDQIDQSREYFNASDKPILSIKDPKNNFVAVDLGDATLNLIEGTSWRKIKSIKTPSNVHGGPKFSSDGRFVFFVSREGWLGKVDLKRFELVSVVRAGINTRNIAISNDGKLLAVANYTPKNVVVFDTDTFKVKRIFEAKTSEGKFSKVSAVYNAPQRSSFVAGFRDEAAMMEISYKNEELREEVRKTEVTLDDFFFDSNYSTIVNTSRQSPGRGHIIDIDSGLTKKYFSFQGMPHLGSGIYFRQNDGKYVYVIPNMKVGKISFFNDKDWNLLTEIDSLGPGFFVRSHPNSKFIWVDNMMSKDKNVITVINKDKLKIEKLLKFPEGITAAHVEYDRSGRYVLLSIRDGINGRIEVYNSNTFKKIRSIPFKVPSGKYNWYNKVNYKEGTSH